MARISRRTFLKSSFLAAGAAAGAGFYGRFIEPEDLQEVRHVFTTPKWNAPPVDFAIAGDLHVGCPSVGLDRLADIVVRLNKMKADVVLLPGDFLTRSVGHYVPPREIAEVLQYLKAPRKFAALGNHDWYNDGRGMWKALEKAGIEVLENRAASCDSLGYKFWIAGLADCETSHPDLKKTFALVNDDAPVLMMTHNPTAFLNKPERAALTIAGHTHGGQVRLPLAGALHLPRNVPRKYDRGYITEEGHDMFITQGIGTSLMPVRFNCPPEIVKLTVSYSKTPEFR
jgi:predicted MPP superfamily phosphohydrolase